MWPAARRCWSPAPQAGSASHIAINTWLGEGGPEGIPSATPEQVAPLYWDLYERRDQAEAVFNG
ncbi:hypothetical protein [Streptomyces coeruleorubidus]